ncbi:VOC family protein [Pinisolibacter sp.]|uniref:VOC family protein n=1 Tax=Pinisolibacter sp. TaxID=2172024 RepID=UPI002FDCCCDF
MTEIRGRYVTPGRPGEFGVHSIDGFRLTVPDLGPAQAFYSAFGLDVREEGAALGLHTFGHGHRWGEIVEGGKKKLSHLSFGAYAEDIDGFRRRLEDQGVKRIDPPSGVASDGLWFLNPDGMAMEIRVADKSSPDEKSPFDARSVGPGRQGSESRRTAPRVHPRRLSHILVFTTDVLGSIAFYERVLGLRLSDRSGDGVAFMHGMHGSDHHMLALAKSGGPGLHHLSWDVGSIHDIGLAAMHMADKGYTEGWGLGRHVLGSNYFHYVRDPWGSLCEYSADIDYIPADFDWQAADNPPEDSFYIWGPNPPPWLIDNSEL